MKKYFFICTNESWGGSENLWFASVSKLLAEGNKVGLATQYHNDKIDQLRSKLDCYVDLKNRRTVLNLAGRIINKFFPFFKSKDILQDRLTDWSPDLVVISHGNHLSLPEMMEICRDKKLSYVILSHIVMDLNWFWLTDELRKRLVLGFDSALKIFFVSQANLSLHQFLLAYQPANAEIVYNPYKCGDEKSLNFPSTKNGFNIALVGRIECYHKGIDLLLRIIASEKWKERKVFFNLYGEGPHVDTIKSLLHQLGIQNVHFKGYCEDVAEIWAINHMLLMPSRMEGQSIALIEALSFGRSAILTNVGGVKEVVDDNITGFIAQDVTVAAIDEAMERAWQRRDEWESMGFKARSKMKSIIPNNPVAHFNSKIENLVRR